MAMEAVGGCAYLDFRWGCRAILRTPFVSKYMIESSVLVTIPHAEETLDKENGLRLDKI